MGPTVPSPGQLFTGPFFENFLIVTRWQTLVWVALLLLAFWLLVRLKKSGKSFSLRMMVALGLGLALGLPLQFLESMPQDVSAGAARIGHVVRPIRARLRGIDPRTGHPAGVRLHRQGSVRPFG